MKRKAKNSQSVEKPKSIVAAYLSVLIIVFIFAIIMGFSSKQILFSPGERSTLSYEDARVLLLDLGDEGIAWYCGEQGTYTDKSGNRYGERELEALQEILGNRFALEREFCS